MPTNKLSGNSKNRVENNKNENYESAMDLPYIKSIIFTLSLIGAWPHQVMGRKHWFSDYRNSKLLVSYWCLLWYSCVSFVVKNASHLDIIEMGKNIINILICSCALQKLFLNLTDGYKTLCQTYLNKMHLFYFKDKSEYCMKMHKYVHKWSTILTVIMLCEVVGGVVLYNLTPIYINYERGMYRKVKPENMLYEQAVNYDIPFDKETVRGYITVFIMNWFVSSEIATGMAIFDLYLCVTLLHLWGHLKILENNLENMPLPAMKGLRENSVLNPPWYDKQEIIQIRSILVENIEYYLTIKKFMTDIYGAYSLTIAANLIYYQITTCIFLLELSMMTLAAFTTFGIIGVNCLQQLMQISIFFEFIGSKNEDIITTVYGVPWENMEPKTRKMVLLYLCIVQNPVEMKALGVLPVGVRTMGSILKTALSYFMLLRALVNGR